MENIFDKAMKLMEMGNIIQKRLVSKELTIPEDIEELKQMIKEKALELASSEEGNELVKIEKTPDKIIIYDMLTLLYHLMDKINGLGGNDKKNPTQRGQ